MGSSIGSKKWFFYINSFWGNGGKRPVKAWILIATMIHRCCPICETNNLSFNRSPFSKNEWNIKKCITCGFVYLENSPHYKDFEEKYAWEKTSAIETLNRKSDNSLFYLISKLIKKFRNKYIKSDKLIDLVNRYFYPGNVLDIGCGGGEVLFRLNKTYMPFGVEISKHLSHQAHQYAISRGGAVKNTHALVGLDSFREDFFEGVIMSAFLEHEINPLDVLKKTLRVLKPGGCLIIKVPNYSSINRIVRGNKWCGFRFPDHVNYWTPSSLIKVLKGVGFNIVRFNRGDRIPTNDNMWVVAGKLSIIK